jgi:DNA topoisomerase I
VKHGSINATVPRDYEPDTLTFEQALEILAAKAAKEGPARSPRSGAEATATRAPAAKRATTRATRKAKDKSPPQKRQVRPSVKKKAATRHSAGRPRD